jgi:DNA invertase Pin-like site-specific DNA recombinase
LRKDGCAKICCEKANGTHAGRRQLLRLFDNLTTGDRVTATRIDRLTRSTSDPFAIVKRIVDAKGQLRSQAEPWADAPASTGRLMLDGRRRGLGGVLSDHQGKVREMS